MGAVVLLQLVLRRLTWRTWWATLFAGTIWLTTWYTPIPTWFSVLLALAAIGALCVLSRKQTDAAA